MLGLRNGGLKKIRPEILFSDGSQLFYQIPTRDLLVCFNVRASAARTTPHFMSLTIIRLRAHGFESGPGDAVGAAFAGAYEAFGFEFFKNIQ